MMALALLLNEHVDEHAREETSINEVAVTWVVIIWIT